MTAVQVKTIEGQKPATYATGGISKGDTSGYEVTLHGTEAIIPMVDGKTIPVEVKQVGDTIQANVPLSQGRSIPVDLTTDDKIQQEFITKREEHKQQTVIFDAFNAVELRGIDRRQHLGAAVEVDEPPVESDHQPRPVLPGGVPVYPGYLLQLPFSQAERLLDEDILAGPERLHHVRGM